MSEDAIAVLEAAEKIRNVIEERITERDKRRAQTRAQVDQHEEQGERYRAIPSSKLVSNDMLNEEKRIRSLATYRDLLARLDAEDEVDREKLHQAIVDVARARLPLMLAEFTDVARSVAGRVQQTREDLMREVKHLHDLRDDAEQTAAAAGIPFRPDSTASVWAATAEPGSGTFPGLFGDPLFIALARAIHSVSRIEQADRTAAAQRAGEAAGRIELGSMTERERLASIRAAMPGHGHTGTARRDQLDAAELARDREQFGHLLPRVASDE